MTSFLALGRWLLFAGLALLTLVHLCGCANSPRSAEPSLAGAAGLLERPSDADYKNCVKRGDWPSCKRAADAVERGKVQLPPSHQTQALYRSTCGRAYPLNAAACMAAALYGRACDSGHGEACWQFVRRLSPKWPAASQAPALRARACALGAGAACHQLAVAQWRGGEVAAVELFERACANRHGPSCTALGEIHAKGLRGLALRPTLASRRFAQGCEAGDARGCVRGGLQLLASDNGAAQHARARTMLERACTLEHAPGCYQLGVLLERGHRRQAADPAAAYGHFKRANALFAKQCAAGDAAACGRRGGMLRAGRGTPADELRGVAMQQRGCALGDAASCVGWLTRGSFLMVAGKSVALRTFVRSCESGDGLGCFMAGRLGAQSFADAGVPWPKTDVFVAGCQRGHGGACNAVGVRRFPATPAGLAALVRGCDIGSAASCYHLGLNLQLPAQEQLPGAVKAFERACGAGYAAACAQWGQLQSSGRGTRIDRIAGAASAQRACDLGDMDGCVNAAQLSLSGAVTPDPAGTDRVLDRACHQRHAAGCAALGRARLRRPETKGARERARALIAKGCRLGDGEACLSIAARLYDEPGAKEKAERAQLLLRAVRAARPACEAAVSVCHGNGQHNNKQWRRWRGEHVLEMQQVPSCGAALERVCATASAAARLQCEVNDASCAASLNLLQLLRPIGLVGAEDLKDAQRAQADACHRDKALCLAKEL